MPVEIVQEPLVDFYLRAVFLPQISNENRRATALINLFAVFIKKDINPPSSLMLQDCLCAGTIKK